MIIKKEKIIINKIKKVVANGSKKLHEPIFIGNEKKYLTDCINSSYVSSIGKFVNKFEVDAVWHFNRNSFEVIDCFIYNSLIDS